MTASIELNFIRKHDKSLPLPLIVVEPYENWAGAYYHPREGELEWYGKYYDMKNGVICISSLWPEDYEGVLAHEWRHHWQFFNKGLHPEWPWNPTDNYNQSIYKYFQAWHEWDALMFEHKYAPTQLSELYIDILYTYKPTQLSYPITP